MIGTWGTRFGGLPGLPGRVTLSAEVIFVMLTSQGGVIRLTGVTLMLQSNLANNFSKLRHGIPEL